MSNAQTKILDLDAFVAAERSVTFNGKDHPVKELSVEYFIKATKAAEEMKRPGITALEEFQKTVELIGYLVPTISTDELSALPLPKLTRLGMFVQGMLDKEIEAAAKKEEAGNEQPAVTPAP